MEQNTKLFRIILAALLGLSALFSVLFAFDVVSEGALLSWCYLLLAIAAITAIVFPIISMAKDPKKAVNALIGIGVLLLVCAIGYALADAKEYVDYDGNLLADAASSRKSEAGLIAFYILGAAAIGSVIFSEVSKMLK